MVICAEKVIETFDERELKYSVDEREDGGAVVVVPFRNFRINLIFEAGDEGSHVALRVVLESCPPDRVGALLVICNSLNSKYRWLKFYIDDDRDIMVEDDAILEPETAGEECCELISRTVSILEEVRPVIMNGIFG